MCIRWVCDWCEGYTTSQDLPHTILPPDTRIDDLPLRVDNTETFDAECAFCGSPHVEYHHWAPSSIFEDWGHVPGVFLCPMHHQEWHHRMRAHGLRYPGELGEAA